MLDIKKAIDELRTKSEEEIERQTAYTWASRAIAAYVLASKEPDPEKKLYWTHYGMDLRHEALEHSALYGDEGKLVEKLQKQIDRFRSQILVKVHANVDVIGPVISELMEKHFKDLPVPTIQLVDTDKGLASFNKEDFVIKIDKSLTRYPDLLRQVLAHELIHYELFLHHGDGVADHGEHFARRADEINAVEGDKYVTEYAEEMA